MSPHINLGANFATFGQYEKAVAETQDALRLDPINIIGYGNLGQSLVAMFRLDEAKAMFDQAQSRKVDGGYLRLVLYYLLFLRGTPRKCNSR